MIWPKQWYFTRQSPKCRVHRNEKKRGHWVPFPARMEGEGGWLFRSDPCGWWISSGSPWNSCRFDPNTKNVETKQKKKLRTSCPACCCSRGRPDQRFACGRVFVTLGRLSRRPSMAQRRGLRNHNIVPAVRSRLIRASINACRYLINSLFDWPYLAGTLINFIETHISR